MTPDKAIVSILREQVNTYKTLLELLKKERVCLVDINPDKIEEISKEKDTVVMRLRLLEEERVRLIKKYSQDSGLTGSMNLEEMARHTGESTFSVLRSQMLSLLQSIEEMNRFNSILINRSLKYIKTTASFFNSFTANHISQTTGVLLSKET
ncbi:MAG: flagellar protein FlgN [Nitrospirae bacterium]|nr:flagellar protein FlgN [Nitrospirota bacterium]